MSRFNTTGSRGHGIKKVGSAVYRLHWVVDRYHVGSRIRHPVGYQRDTDEAGAERFSKKWGVAIPTHGITKPQKGQ